MDVHICADRPAAGFTGALALAMVLAVGSRNTSASSGQEDTTTGSNSAVALSAHCQANPPRRRGGRLGTVADAPRPVSRARRGALRRRARVARLAGFAEPGHHADGNGLHRRRSREGVRPAGQPRHRARRARARARSRKGQGTGLGRRVAPARLPGVEGVRRLRIAASHRHRPSGGEGGRGESSSAMSGAATTRRSAAPAKVVDAAQMRPDCLQATLHVLVREYILNDSPQAFPVSNRRNALSITLALARVLRKFGEPHFRVGTSWTGGCGRSRAFDERRECLNRTPTLLRARGGRGASEWSGHRIGTEGRMCHRAPGGGVRGIPRGLLWLVPASDVGGGRQSSRQVRSRRAPRGRETVRGGMPQIDRGRRGRRATTRSLLARPRSKPGRAPRAEPLHHTVMRHARAFRGPSRSTIEFRDLIGVRFPRGTVE